MMGSEPSTPPRSRSTSSSPKRNASLTLDLSDLPPLTTPSPPSNTLIVTNLLDPEIFAQATLAHLRELINKHTADSVYSFSPIRSFRRIIITFYTTDAAIAIRALLDGEVLFNSRIRIYFGEQTPISLDNDATRHLAAPKSEKQFFISPPPSPPHGWESKEEDPPNKDVHAEDLAEALQRLNARGQADAASRAQVASYINEASGRKRSGSVIVFDPHEGGHSPDLPAIAVEDTTDSPDAMSPSEPGRSRVAMPKTERPPTDLAFGN